MKISDFKTLPDETLVFCDDSEYYTSPDEYFANNQDADSCKVFHIKGGKLMPSLDTYLREYLNEDPINLRADFFLAVDWKRIATQRAGKF